MASRRVTAPATVGASYSKDVAQSPSLMVAVRVRPLLEGEQKKRDILRVLDSKLVTVLDPDTSKDYLDQMSGRNKEKSYTFDVAFDTKASNHEVYDRVIKGVVGHVLEGVNTTVFAYGATGSGKTHTMVGNASDPGLMVLSLQRIFEERAARFAGEEVEVDCSYLEVYNEQIFDLLVARSDPLELREDPEQGATVAGLRSVRVDSAADIMALLEAGNRRRKQDSTDANATSSRSHAVLEIQVRRQKRHAYRAQQVRAKLSLVDLAGSERAADTNNSGQKLRDGANINRSLLALANCINALGKSSRGGSSYVPFRNSKLTRLLKHGLSGNSRTLMIATISASHDQYYHSINTLKYADRAKEIKTCVVANVGTVEAHVTEYQRIIDGLNMELQQLRSQLAQSNAALAEESSVRSLVSAGGGGAGRGSGGGSGAGGGGNDAQVMGQIDNLVQEMSEHIEDTINLQKAVFEVEDASLNSKYELQGVCRFIQAARGTPAEMAEAEARRADLLAAIADNEEACARYKSDIQANEAARQEVQARIDALMEANHGSAMLNMLRTFQLQAVRLQEVKLAVAVRDQIISEQRQVIDNCWRLVHRAGISRDQVKQIAKEEGLRIPAALMGDEEAWPAEAGAGAAGSSPDVASSSPVPQGARMQAHAGQPQPYASIMGAQAKYRYRFWAQQLEDVPSPPAAAAAGAMNPVKLEFQEASRSRAASRLSRQSDAEKQPAASASSGQVPSIRHSASAGCAATQPEVSQRYWHSSNGGDSPSSDTQEDSDVRPEPDVSPAPRPAAADAAAMYNKLRHMKQLQRVAQSGRASDGGAAELQPAARMASAAPAPSAAEKLQRLKGRGAAGGRAASATIAAESSAVEVVKQRKSTLLAKLRRGPTVA